MLSILTIEGVVLALFHVRVISWSVYLCEGVPCMVHMGSSFQLVFFFTCRRLLHRCGFTCQVWVARDLGLSHTGLVGAPSHGDAMTSLA